MITISQAQNGIMEFIQREVIPNLSIAERFFVGSGANLFAVKLPEIVEKYARHPAVELLGIYNPERKEIDIDALYEAIKPNIGADPIPIEIPVIGLTLKITQAEIESLYKFIKGAAK